MLRLLGRGAFRFLPGLGVGADGRSRGTLG
jgi:hypothetical protein